MRIKAQIMDEQAMERALSRIAHEIIERNDGGEELLLVGIRTRGVFLANRLCEHLKKADGSVVPVGILDITMYRDDFENGMKPALPNAALPFDVRNKKIVLVDDVLFTGRTVRAAIDALISLGRPKCIQLAVLVDRGHRELPFKADFIGKNLPTSKSEVVSVNMMEKDGENSVILYDMND